MVPQEQNERAPLSSLLEARLDDDATVRQVAEVTLDEHAQYEQGYYGATHQHEGPQHMSQTRNPYRGVRIPSSWWHLLFAAFSVGMFFFLMQPLFYAYGVGGYSLSLIHLARLLIICITLVGMNLLVQRKSFSALLRLQQGGRSPANSWMGIALAILSIIVLADQVVRMESDFVNWSGADTVFHFVVICKIIALGVVAMTMLLINRIFHLR